MNTIKIQGIEYRYPSGWNELTVATFDAIQHKLETLTDAKGVRQMVGVYSVVTGVSEQTYLDGPPDLFNEVARKLEWLNTPPDGLPKLEQKVNGVLYEFPNTLNKITLAEFADLDECLKMDGKINASILAVLFRPKGEAYNADLFYQRQEFWQGRPVTDILPLISFFFQIENASQILTKTFSRTGEAVLLKLIQCETLVKSGGGLRRRLTLREGIYLKLIRYYKKTLLKYLISLPT